MSMANIYLFLVSFITSTYWGGSFSQRTVPEMSTSEYSLSFPVILYSSSVMRTGYRVVQYVEKATKARECSKNKEIRLAKRLTIVLQGY